MATAKRHSLYPCSFVHSGGTLDFDQLESFDIDAAANFVETIVGGSVDRAAMTTLGSADPKATLATRDLATLFATVSITTGLDVISTGATFRAQQRASNGVFSTGSVHETFTSTKGFLYPTSITASQDDGEGAICELEYVALWDGSTLPIVSNTNVSFGAITTPAFSNRYFLGPVYHNSTQLDNVTSVSINPGIEYVAKRYDGDPFPKLGAIVARRPSITVELEDIETVSGITSFGNVATTLVCYLQHAADNAQRVAAGTATHTKVTVTTGNLNKDNVRFSGPQADGSATLTVIPDGTIAIATNSAIP